MTQKFPKGYLLQIKEKTNINGLGIFCHNITGTQITYRRLLSCGEVSKKNPTEHAVKSQGCANSKHC